MNAPLTNAECPSICLFDRGRRDADRLAWYDPSRRVSYGELLDDVVATACRLRAEGVERGDVVALILPDGYDALRALHAVVWLHAVALPVDPELGAAETARQLDDAGVRCVIVDSTFSARLDSALELSTGTPHVVEVHRTGGLAPTEALTPLAARGDARGLVTYTSGSTGLPKRVEFRRSDLLTDARHLAEAAGIGPNDRVVCTAPFHHSYGLDSAIFLALWSGAALGALADGSGAFRARAADWLALCKRAEATVLVSVPLQLDILSRAAREPQPTLRHVFSTGSPLPRDVFDRVRSSIGSAVVSLFGSTEIGTISGDLGPDIDPTTVGLPLLGVQIRTVDEHGDPVDEGMVGHVEVRSRVPLRRYAGQTAASMTRDGWYRTGDRGRFDDAGRLVLDGRVTRQVDVGGFTFDPREVERLIAGMDDVRDAVVLMVEHDSGPVLEAVFSGEATPHAVRSRCMETLAPFKVPARCTRLDAFPRTAAGKIRRPALRAILLDRARPASTDLHVDDALRHVLEQATRVLGDRPPLDGPLHEAGATSAQLVEIAGRLSEALSRPLSASVLFDHPSPRALADWLAGRRTALEIAPAPGPGNAEVAIVSMACRLPGGVDSPAALWTLLDDGVDATGPFPTDRGWALDAVFDPDRTRAGCSYVDRGGFINDAAGFDPALFGLSPREAATIEPQQRVVLELAWQAFDRAGLDPRRLRSRRIGCFIGLWQSEWLRRMPRADEADDGQPALGAAPSVASGRVSYVFGLTGPTMTIDTACSSSLVALHVARRALQAGECDMALVGGATVFTEPDDFIWFSRLQALSPDGRSKAFAAGADGAGWAEGAGLVLLERRDDARRAGRPVLATVRGSAINHDGRSQGLTAPSGRAQQQVIGAALADAGLSPDDIDAVEAHGTGTVLGDRIEADALQVAYKVDRRPRPLWLGSVKSNLGHTQAAAGIVGVMKSVLAMNRGWIPPTLHADPPHPALVSAGDGLRLIHERVEWPSSIRRMGVSSFGVSGTNAHVIVEWEPTPARTADPTTRALPLLLSGQTPRTLAREAERWASWLATTDEIDWRAVIRTAALSRASLPTRAGVVAKDPAAAVDALRALADGRDHARLVRGSGPVERPVVFVFPGSGSQWPGMGRALLESTPAFAAAVDACDAALAPHTSWSLRAVLAGDPDAPSLTSAAVIQPTLFGMSVALARTWRAWGIEPEAVIGHSNGEVAAAVVAGALSLADGARLIALRCALVARLDGTGGMMAVRLPASEVEALLADFDDLSLAVVNDDRSTVVAGGPSALDALSTVLSARNVFHRRVGTTYASHSAHVDPLLPELRDALRHLRSVDTPVRYISSARGGVVPGSGLDAAYWCDNLRQPVRFDRALDTLDDGQPRAFVELSGRPLLTTAIDQRMETRGGVAVGSLDRDDGEPDRLMAALATLHCVGGSVDWETIVPDPRIVAELPPRVFDHQPFWPTPRRGDRPAGFDAIEHAFVEHGMALPDGGVLLLGRLGLDRHPWLADHLIDGRVLFPGTGYVDLALLAAHRAGLPIIEELVNHAPLVLEPRRTHALRVEVRRDGQSGTVRVETRPEGVDDAPWTRHVDARLASTGAPLDFDLKTWPPAGAEPVDVADFYAELARIGHAFGPAFRTITRAWTSSAFVYVECCPDDGAADGSFCLDPALLDGAMQGSSLFDDPELVLPFSWQGVRLDAEGARTLRVRLRRHGRDAELEIADHDGLPIARIARVRNLVVESSHASAGPGEGWSHSGTPKPANARHRVEWSALPLAAVSGQPSAICIVGPTDGAARLQMPEARWAPDLETALADAEARVVVLDVDATDARPPTADAVIDAVDAVLSDIRRWLERPAQPDQRLMVLTRGAWATPALSSPLDPMAAAVAAAVISAGAERPDAGLVVVDLGPQATGTDLLAAIATDEDRVALHGGRRWVPRLASDSSPSPPMAPVDDAIVTGGTGALGARCALRLASHHRVRRVHLLSRRGRAAGVEALVQAIEQAGATAIVHRADVGDEAAVERVCGVIPTESSLLIVHAAGVLDDGLVGQMTRPRIEKVVRPKVQGVLNLERATRHHDVVGFVCFASASGVIGSAGQSNYAAANAFLDAWAVDRRNRGAAATSLAWGTWAGEGMTAGLSDSARRRLARSEVLLTADDGMALFDDALGLDRGHQLLMRFPRAALPAADIPPILRGTLRARRRVVSEPQRVAQGARPTNRAAALDQVLRCTASVLGYDEPDALMPDAGFFDQGLDSLMAVELRNRLRRAVDMDLAATVAFDHPTPRRLAEHIAAAARPRVVEQVAPPAVEQPAEAAHGRERDIAIVGIGLRLPGGVDDLDALHRLLADGGDAVGPCPAGRFDLDGRYDPDPERPDTSYVRRAGWLDDITDFDPGAFGISPREAAQIDPHQRLLLETAWEALERAGIPPDSLTDSATGVYVGLEHGEYHTRHERAYAVTGRQSAFASGRLAYAFGLQGPALTVNTACSSSLTALHLAVRAIRGGECDLALAGGAKVFMSADEFVMLSGMKALAPDGRCKTFSDRADGYGRGEGVVVVVLQRLSDALRLNRPVLGVIKGTGVTNDGASSSLMTPNGASQQRAVRAGLDDARLGPNDIDAVECHGTGTVLGDPIEVNALAAVYGPGRDPERALLIGCVKPTIGHLEEAAGLAGVARILAALRHETWSATRDSSPPNRFIDWASMPIRVGQSNTPWPRGSRVRRAAVSAFGLSGTNAHIVIEEAPRESAAGPTPHGAAPLPLVLSATDRASLAALGSRWHAWLADEPDVPWSSVVEGSISGRSRLPQRAAITAYDPAAVRSALAALAADRAHPDLVIGHGRSMADPVFVFPGQGSQWPGMGRALLDTEPAFAHAIGECAAALARHIDWSLEDVLCGRPSAPTLDRVDVVQPALFAMGYGLAQLWMSRGVRPAAVVGHSQGEIVAAVLAGALTLDDAARVITIRSRLVRRLAGSGAMAAIGAPVSAVEGWLDPDADLSVAVVNGDASTVIAGSPDEVERFVESRRDAGIFCRMVAVDYASHSAHVDPLLPELTDALVSLSTQPGEIEMVSTVTGALVTRPLGPEYWCDNLRQAVRFDLAVETLRERGHTVFLEVSPHPLLLTPLSAAVSDDDLVLGTLRRDEDPGAAWRETWATLVCNGLDPRPAVSSRAPSVERLPTYAFRRRSFPIQPRVQRHAGSLGQATGAHPLVGAAIELPDGGWVLTGRLSLSSADWVTDHRVGGRCLLPGTALVELALHAAGRVGSTTLDEIVFASPILLDESTELDLRVSLDTSERPGAIRIYTRDATALPGAQWTLNASAEIGHDPTRTDAFEALVPACWPPAEVEALDVAALEADLEALGYGFGPRFQGLSAAWHRGDRAFAEADQPTDLVPADHHIHPAVLDAVLHADAVLRDDRLSLPVAWHRVRLVAPIRGAMRASMRRTPDGVEALVTDARGTPCLYVGSMVHRAVDGRWLEARPNQYGNWRLTWIEAAGAAPVDLGRWGALTQDEAYPAVRTVTSVACAIEDALDGVVKTGDAASSAPDDLGGILATLADDLALLQTWMAEPRSPSLRLTRITCHAVAAAPGEAAESLPQSALWGLWASAWAEHPDHRLQLIDHDGHPESTAAIAQALAHQAPRLAIRRGRLFEPRLAPVDAERPDDALPRLVADARIAVITGGTGGLGGALALHLARSKGFDRLVLTSRRGQDSPSAAALGAQLKDLGVNATFVADDISAPSALRAVFETFEDDEPLLVVHTAGVLDDGVMLDLDPERLSRVLQAKVGGALALEQMLRDRGPTGFIWYSSLSGVEGTVGQANYAAANLVLDALSSQLRANGRPALSLAWGAWGEVGLMQTLEPSVKARLARTGTPLMSVERALALFDDALGAADACVAPLALDPDGLGRRMGPLSPIYADLARQRPRVSSRLTLRAPSEVDPANRASWARQTIADVLGSVSGHDPDTISAETRVNGLGLDSLMALQVRDRLRRGTGVSIPVTALLDDPTIEALGALLVEEAFGSPGSPTADGLGDRRCTLICFTHAAGDASAFAGWSGSAPAWLDVVAMEPPGRGTRADEPAIDDYAKLIADIVERVLRFDPAVPIAIYGHSMGGWVAYGVAQALQSRRTGPIAFFVSGIAAPDRAGTDVEADVEHLDDSAVLSRLGMPEALLDTPEGQTLLGYARTDLDVSRSRPPAVGRLDCPVFAFAGADDPLVRPDAVGGWRAFANGPFDIVVEPGDHWFVYRQSTDLVGRIARELEHLVHPNALEGTDHPSRSINDEP